MKIRSQPVIVFGASCALLMLALAPNAFVATRTNTIAASPRASERDGDHVSCWVFRSAVSLPVVFRLVKSPYVRVDLAAWEGILAATEHTELPVEALREYQGCRAFFVVSSTSGHGEPRAEGLLPNGRTAWLKLSYLSAQDHSRGDRVTLGDCVWAPGNEWDGESMHLKRPWMEVTDQAVTVFPAPDLSPRLSEAVVVYQFDDARLGPATYRVQPLEIP